MVVRRTLVAVLSASVLALTACGGGDRSVADPPPLSPTSSPPTSSPPERETPEHFIRRWVEVDEQMQNTGKTADYLSISRGCVPCLRVARLVKRFYAAGGYVRWGGWTVRRISHYADEDKGTVMKVFVRSEPTIYKASSRAATKRLEGGRSIELLTIRRDGDSWQMTNTAELPS